VLIRQLVHPSNDLNDSDSSKKSLLAHPEQLKLFAMHPKQPVICSEQKSQTSYRKPNRIKNFLKIINSL
jgi:hypothetical protein